MPNTNDDLDWSKSFMYAIHQTYFLAEKRLEHRLLTAKGITFSQFLILLAIHCKKHPSQRVVADFLYLTEATVSRHVFALEQIGLLSRESATDNRRQNILSMTQKGATAFAAAHKIIDAELNTIFSSIPKKDRALIMQAFQGVIKVLNHRTLTP
jgi:DNA-binding MarR family transcriptional regulator